MIRQFNANQARLRRHRRIRRGLGGSEERPRLSVFRSGQHIYAQVIDDSTGRTLAAASSLEETLRSLQVTPKAAPAATPRAAGTEEAPAEMAAEVAPARGKNSSPSAPKRRASAASSLIAVAMPTMGGSLPLQKALVKSA